MTKKSGQKRESLENEKSFSDEMKSIFYLFQRTFNETNNTIFLGR